MNIWISPAVKQLWNYAMHVMQKIGFNINPTAFCLGRSSLHHLLLKSSMDQPSHQKNLTSYSKCKKVESKGFFFAEMYGKGNKMWNAIWCRFSCHSSWAQCDQIRRFIGLWATFQSLWQQLICPILLHSYEFFCKGVEIFIFSSEIIFGQLL